ncbi:hypothetical protein QQS21_005399 [Conoideocrella luteorostrata]|uniref:Cell wall galactomannoprotein n=1 Tax=Conoideocrella luteorostrata TaxID=1105319 RepID=A0AAJ0CPH7_9HYPO|nr:hypothetical protein QQS21_005399 [Conoideocrella luteorostrata]
MKPTTITLLAVASLAQGLVVPRDQKTVTDVLTGVQTGIDNLDTAVKSCCSNLGGLLDASNKLIAAITGGTSTVSSSTPLTLIEAIKIIKPVQAVEAHAKTLVSDIKGQKAQIVQAGLCGVFAQQIETINGDSQQLVKTTVGKVPQIAQSVATKVAQGILDVLADAKDAFSAANCK